MQLARKGHPHSHRGAIGVEAAIVLVAFVIVAAALAFVVLNMGFATTQKAKTSIISSLLEAGSSLEVSGKVVGYADSNADPPVVNATSIPVKITSGGDSVDLDDSRVTIKYISNNVEYSDILDGCTLSSAITYVNSSKAFDAAVTDPDCQLSSNPLIPPWTIPTDTTAVIFWSVASNTNVILDQGEHANIAIAFSQADRPVALDTIRTEVILSAGATLTVERDIPVISNSIIDLG